MDEQEPETARRGLEIYVAWVPGKNECAVMSSYEEIDVRAETQEDALRQFADALERFRAAQ